MIYLLVLCPIHTKTCLVKPGLTEWNQQQKTEKLNFNDDNDNDVAFI